MFVVWRSSCVVSYVVCDVRRALCDGFLCFVFVALCACCLLIGVGGMLFVVCRLVSGVVSCMVFAGCVDCSTLCGDCCLLLCNGSCCRLQFPVAG